jgi:uncharacterized membrane protein SirB2
VILAQFSQWLAATAPSNLIQATTWIIPSVQTLHIVAIAVVMSSILMIDIRLLGVGSSSQTVRQTGERYLPWMWRALPVLLVTGLILIVGEPARELLSPAFWLKMTLLLTVVMLTIAFHRALERGRYDGAALPVSVKAYAVVSLVLWIGVIAAGRAIAYLGHF